MKTRAKIITVILAVVLGAAGLVCWAVWYSVTVTIPNAYAVWSTATYINDYMDAHEGAWPAGWNDLRAGSGDKNTPEHWADLQKRVEVDWTADPRVLAALPEPTEGKLSFRVIWLKNGSNAHWAGAEPNSLIWNHLRRATTMPTTREMTGPAQ